MNKILTIAIATGAFLAMVGTALALPLATGEYQTVKMKVSPSKLAKKKYKPTSLKVTTGTGLGTKAPGNPGVPPPAVRALVWFDNDIKLNISSKAQCDPTTIAGLSTDMAKAACPNSIVGSGSAAVRIPGVAEGPGSSFESTSATVDGVTYAGEVEARITAFRATDDPGTGRKRIILYSRVDAIAVGSPLIGVLKSSSAKGKDYKTLLDVDIPPLPLGSALTRFSVTIRKSFVRSRCADKNRRLNVNSEFQYTTTGTPEPETYLPAKNSQRCRR